MSSLKYPERTVEECRGALHPKALAGLRRFNEGNYFDAHEELEDAWRDESGAVRDLYRGILQIAVTYLHILRGNYDGAVKVYGRSLKWTQDWQDVCRGVQVGKLRRDADAVMQEVLRLGKENIGAFERSLLKSVEYEDEG
ncbi:MAG: DUF309 domain-containing protein [Anaerolineales bacterium]|nr:DUF309 domain-containing protein [Anaerolineales bacterium]